MSYTIDSLAIEIARIRRELDDIKSLISPSTGQTTKLQRIALRKHIAQLDSESRKTKPKPNPFIINQKVDMVEYHPGRERGLIEHIACKNSLPSIHKKVKSGELPKDHIVCDKATCQHDKKNYCFVRWPNGKLFAYNFTDLKLLTDDDLKPRIGRELSGKIGQWTYNHETKIWKKDGSDKEYTASEFDTEMYFEENPDEKEDAEAFVRAIMKDKSKNNSILEKKND